MMPIISPPPKETAIQKRNPAGCADIDDLAAGNQPWRMLAEGAQFRRPGIGRNRGHHPQETGKTRRRWGRRRGHKGAESGDKAQPAIGENLADVPPVSFVELLGRAFSGPLYNGKGCWRRRRRGPE